MGGKQSRVHRNSLLLSSSSLRTRLWFHIKVKLKWNELGNHVQHGDRLYIYGREVPANRWYTVTSRKLHNTFIRFVGTIQTNAITKDYMLRRIIAWNARLDIRPWCFQSETNCADFSSPLPTNPGNYALYDPTVLRHHLYTKRSKRWDYMEIWTRQRKIVSKWNPFGYNCITSGLIQGEKAEITSPHNLVF